MKTSGTSLKKKVICVVNDKDKFERELNSIEGKFTQTSVTCNGTDLIFFAVLFYEE